MEILITGGTGFVGTALSAYLKKSGHKVTILSTRKKSGDEYEYLLLPSKGELLDSKIIEKMDGIINLAGSSISSDRWTREKKVEILESRIHVTNVLIDSIARNKSEGKKVPEVLINASAVGYYGTHPEKTFREDAPSGEGFLAMVASKWEKEAFRAREYGVRLVILRFGIVLGPNGGMLQQMSKPFSYGVGGKVGSGKQWMSWIHRSDLVAIMGATLENSDYQGVYNACSPNPVTMSKMATSLGKALGKKSWTVLPAFMAKIVFGGMAKELLLEGQRALPSRLESSGYKFLFPEIEEALNDIY